MGEVVSESIEIAAPIEAVWDLVMDPERLGEWVTIHRSVADVPAGDLVTGSRFRQKLRLKGVPLEVRWEVTECSAPHRARWAGTAAAGAKARISYDLSESDGGTRFDYENEFELPAGKAGKLLPGSIRGRYEALEWLMFQMGGVGPIFGQVHHFLRAAKEAVPYSIERYVKETRRLYGVLDERLRDHEYLAGEYSIADIATYPWTARYEWHKTRLEDFPHVKRWFDAISARPAVQRGMKVPS